MKVSQWSNDVRKALIDKNMIFGQLARCIGYSAATVSQIINGRYSNASYQEIAKKINEVLGTKGVPERINTPSDEWCQSVKIELIKRKMSVNQLAERLNVTSNRLSLVINGRVMNEKIVNTINELLNIKEPVISSSHN